MSHPAGVFAVALLWCAAGAAAQPWNDADAGTRSGLRGLAVAGERVIWIGGTDGTLRRSTDAGVTWSRLAPPGSEALDFRDIHAFDARRALVMAAGPGARSRLFVTRDGGISWHAAYAPDDARVFLDGLAFRDGRHGLAFGDPLDGRLLLLHSDDGGISWRADARAPAVEDGEAAFAASGTSIATLGRRAWIGTGGTRARVLRSSDGGRSWESASVPLRQGAPSAGVFSLAFWSADEGVAVGGDYKQPDEREGTAAFTRDGGRTWSPAQRLPGGYRSAVAMVPGRSHPPRLVAVGTSGADVSDDGGRTWRAWPEAGTGLNAVATTPRGRVWMVGPEGRVRTLAPAGETR
jgi:photosystem II stability/assembly factor-like uncharacterized protein